MSSEAFDLVDWLAIGRALRLKPQLFRVWASKHHSHFCATGARMHMMRMWTSPACRCWCDQVARETTSHLFLCTHPLMTRLIVSRPLLRGSRAQTLTRALQSASCRLFSSAPQANLSSSAAHRTSLCLNSRSGCRNLGPLGNLPLNLGMSLRPSCRRVSAGGWAFLIKSPHLVIVCFAFLFVC